MNPSWRQPPESYRYPVRPYPKLPSEQFIVFAVKHTGGQLAAARDTASSSISDKFGLPVIFLLATLPTASKTED